MQITDIQKTLSDAGYCVGAIDGVYGVRTRGAVMAVQRLSGLLIDGIVGAKTEAVLQNPPAPVVPPIPPDYKQHDPRWRYNMYSRIGDANQTMGSSGCGAAAASMAVEGLLYNDWTPWDAALYSMANGYRTARDGTAWGYFRTVANKFHLDFAQSDDDALILCALQSGGLPVCSMSPGRWTSGGHYINPWRLDCGKTPMVAINDCGISPSSTPSRKKAYEQRIYAPFTSLASQCKQTFAFWLPYKLAQKQVTIVKMPVKEPVPPQQPKEPQTDTISQEFKTLQFTPLMEL